MRVDSVTHTPVVVRNDNGMEGIFIYIFGFDTVAGVELYIEAIKNYTSTGAIDGFFGDKWGSAAEPVNGNPTSAGWKICNHECGNVTKAQGLAWNAGKAKALDRGGHRVRRRGPVLCILGFGLDFDRHPQRFTRDVTNYVPMCALFLALAALLIGASFNFCAVRAKIRLQANGDFFEGVESNFNGHWATAPLFAGDPRHGIADVRAHLKGFGGNHTYTYVAACGDQHWTTDPNAPESLQAQCVGSCHARFLLAVEEGAFLGSNGWDKSYDYPLGDPAGPAEYTEAFVNDAGVTNPATLTRNFSTGTYVVFTYNDKGDDGEGVIFWLGKPPAPTPPPTPPPIPPTPAPLPPPAGPPIQCGGGTSSFYNATTFAEDDVAPSSAATAAACCACAKASACVEWAFHTKDAAKQPGTCHLHGPNSVLKTAMGCVAGVMMRVLDVINSNWSIMSKLPYH